MRQFQPVRNLTYARFMDRDLFGGGRKATGVRMAGLRYERKAQAMLLDTYPLQYIPGCFIEYRQNNGKLEYCQPDGFLLDMNKGLITLIEIKLRHTELAWWQLFHLYGPVLEYLFGDMFHYAYVELCAWFDPETAMPQKTYLIPDILKAKPGLWSIHICNL